MRVQKFNKLSFKKHIKMSKKDIPKTLSLIDDIFLKNSFHDNSVYYELKLILLRFPFNITNDEILY